LARRIVAAVVFALLVVGFVVVRVVDRTDTTTTVVAGPPDPVLPTVMHAKPTRYTVVATPVTGAGRLYLQVGTYLEQPKDTIVLDVRDAGGARMARCVFPPASYTDNGQLRCPLADISRARSLIVTRRGTAKIALYGHEEQAGYLVKNEAGSYLGRVSTALSRIAVPLPNGMGSAILLSGLFGSVALVALVLLTVVRRPRRRPARDTTENSNWLYSDPYYSVTGNQNELRHHHQESGQHSHSHGSDAHHDVGSTTDHGSSGSDSGGSGDSGGGDSAGGGDSGGAGDSGGGD
jgi:uncharacterized membrane protein YgcG